MIQQSSQTEQKKIDNKILQDIMIANAPQSTNIKQYLNMKRYAKDKICLWIFLLSFAMTIIILGIGFFFSNYSKIGQVVSYNHDYATCMSSCTTGQTAYLQIVCLSQPQLSTYSVSSQLGQQISIYNLKYCYDQIVYVTAGLLFLTAACYAIIVFFPKIIYCYVVCVFLMILGLAFYLLRRIKSRESQYSEYLASNSILYSDEQRIAAFAYLLISIYLVVFPFILFSPRKIQMAIRILATLRQFFYQMIYMHIFTLTVILIAWGSLMLEIFLFMNFFSDGEPYKDSSSFLYLYNTIYLRNPAALLLHFFGVYWNFATLVSWHKYFVSTSIYLWYFHSNEAYNPIKRGIQKSYKHIGSAAIDALLTPIEWICLILFAITKTSKKSNQQKEGVAGFIENIQEWIKFCYQKVNRGSPSSAISCFQSAEMLENNKHKFFNIGGTLTIFLTLFCCVLWILICYIIMDLSIYNTSFPPPVTTLTFPIVAVFLSGLVIGNLYSNIFTSTLDCLIFCFLMQKTSKRQTQQQKNDVQKILEECYNREEEKIEQQLYIDSDNSDDD